jgi:hypothetical protein
MLMKANQNVINVPSAHMHLSKARASARNVNAEHMLTMRGL